MSETTIASNNKRIAKNTLLLYGRMLLIMAVSLFTSRVVLNTLGVEDYGIYNVVGSVVTMFAFLNGALVTSTQRYLTFDLGKSDYAHLKIVFTTSIYIHALISLAIIVLAETVGLWFFYYKMVIPAERMTAAMWVYQLSIVTMVIQVMSAPYNSIIVAHERMGVFAVISILETVLKLLIVYVLLVWIGDKLIFYAILVAAVQLLIRIVYTRYCKTHFEESVLTKGIDRPLLAEMSKFAGWNIWGNLAAALFGTGLNLLLNVFFGPVVNAARGIAVQVESAIAQFSTNFLMAVNPQITKLYAQDNLDEMHRLLFRASKFTCYLLLMLSLPVAMETQTILVLWLKIVPDYTVQFIQVLLAILIIDSMARPLMTAAAATGDVKKYQSIIGGILLSIVPIAYIVLKLGGNPVSVYFVHLSVCIVAFLARLVMIRPMIKLSLRQFFMSVLLPCGIVFSCSLAVSLIIKTFISDGLAGTILMCTLSALLVAVFAYSIGLTKGERAFVNEKIAVVFNKIPRHD